MFETNSSSTHTLTICSKDDFDKWEHGEVFWLDNDWHKLDTNKNFVTPEELKELAEKYNEEQQERIDAGDKFAKVLDIDKVLNERPDYYRWRDSYWDTERSSTMYVDMVNREFAANSTSETRYPLLDNIEDMLKVIHQEKKGKDID